MSGGSTIQFREVSKFYGEVLGVNRVSLEIPPGLTSLVGPNGSGKSTLMHLTAGLLQPSQGAISVLGIPPTEPERLFALVGYCTQYDSFPGGVTGLGFLAAAMELHGKSRAEAAELAWTAIKRVGLEEAANRRVAGCRGDAAAHRRPRHLPRTQGADSRRVAQARPDKARRDDRADARAPHGCHAIVSATSRTGGPHLGRGS
jgi:ABC-type sugar transport system ATPase subunit